MKWPWQRKKSTATEFVPATPIGSVPFFESAPIGYRIRRTMRFFTAMHGCNPDTLHVTSKDLYELLGETEFIHLPITYNGVADGYSRYYGLRVIEASPIAPASASYVSLELGENAVYDWREDLL